ncbi:hypothetical protein [Ralstonia phage RP31]|uniref:Uncharacterized protein n=2 Tax=Ripduovirus RP12 TaxID=2560700 RepID=A0A1L7N0U9_9CAUD|nr:hypothetical protein FDH28_gp127 [Ralstonia phage RP12]BAW19101.1 hypothetical protein [Ralstonia phage RP12]BAW19387.1 hypothetical protein [Ralstonia phage RP31]
MGLKVLSLDGQPGLGLEQEEVYDWTKQLWDKLEDRVWSHPQVTFQKEDVDERIVRELIQHKELLEAVERWITVTDYSLLPKLREAKRVFEAIQPPPVRETLYRGFSPKDRNHDEAIKALEVGETYSYTPNSMMSFSFHKGTVKDFGDTIVSVPYADVRDRMFHITNEIVMAYMVRDIKDFNLNSETKFPTFGESVFLPDGRAITLTMVSKG